MQRNGIQPLTLVPSEFIIVFRPNAESQRFNGINRFLQLYNKSPSAGMFPYKSPQFPSASCHDRLFNAYCILHVPFALEMNTWILLLGKFFLF